MNKQSCLWFGMLAVAVAIAVGASATAISAAPPNLPPRPTVIALPTLAPGPRSADSKPRGAWIELRAQAINRPIISSVVQWQDGLGEWHDVDSWRGEFDEVVDGVGKKTWWLEEWLFGAGPFRWVVYDRTSGQVLAQTAPFNMPREHRQTLRVDALLP